MKATIDVIFAKGENSCHGPPAWEHERFSQRHWLGRFMLCVSFWAVVRIAQKTGERSTGKGQLVA
jgi:hypothetical protein